MNLIGNGPTEFFYNLTPEVIDASFFDLGLKPSGRVLALNSLENRVYEVEISDKELGTSVIVKFYRPNRWSRESILEEHEFLNELYELEIPVIAPLKIHNKTLHVEKHTGLYYALFPKVRGRLKDELNKEEIDQIGRLLGRIHNVGSVKNFQHRPNFTPENYILSHFEQLRSADFLPSDTVKNYLLIAEQIKTMILPYFQHLTFQRIHGDLHRGNILWTSNGPVVLDLDDCVNGPCEQDLWLLLSGRDEYSKNEREQFISAYETMSKKEINLSPFLMEAFRSMRLIHFNGWITKRWADPSFKNFYFTFESQNYWEAQLLDLKEQLGLLQDLSSN